MQFSIFIWQTTKKYGKLSIIKKIRKGYEKMSKSILDPKNLGPDRPFKQDQKYSNFIQSFIDEYENLIDIKTLIKLQVLESYIMCKPPKKIKEKLQSMCDDNNYPEYTKEQISPYLSPDNKKITRLWKASTKQQQLPYLIGIGNLVNMVVEKYPFPSLIGIPFDIWNEKRILKYIRLRFEIKNELYIKRYFTILFEKFKKV